MVVGHSLRYLLIFFISNGLLTIRPIDAYRCYSCNTGEGWSCKTDSPDVDLRTTSCDHTEYCIKANYKFVGGDDESHIMAGCDDYNEEYCPDKDGQTVTRNLKDYNGKETGITITGTVYCCRGGRCNDPDVQRPKDTLQCIACDYDSDSHCAYTRAYYCDKDVEYCSTDIKEIKDRIYDIEKGCGDPDFCPRKNGERITDPSKNNYYDYYDTQTVYCCKGDSCNAAHETKHHLQCFTCNEYGGISCDFPATTYCASTVKYCSKVVYEIHGYEYFARGCDESDHCPGKDGEVIEYSYGAERTEYCCEGDKCNAAQETRNTITWTIGPALFLLSKVEQLF